MITTPEIRWLAIAPELTLAIGVAVVLLSEVQWKPSARALGWVTAGAIAVAAYFSILQWWDLRLDLAGQAFSGMISLDGLAVFARLALLVVSALGMAAGWRFIEALGRRGAEGIALVLLATAGFSIMVGANNLVMLFLGLEIGSISLYVLAGMTRERSESDEAAIKYFLLGSFASAFFIYGVALVYAGTGQFGIDEVRAFLSDFVLINPAVIYIGIGLMVAGLGFKVSAAPFHTWAPDVYQGAPAGIVGYLAAVAKIAGFAAITRILLTAFGDLASTWAPLVGAVAALSMLVGSVLALVQKDIRRMLAYSGVAHAGFILTGVVGGASAGVMFYLAVYALQLVGAFAVVAVVSGSSSARSSIEEYRGLGRTGPTLAGALTVLLLGMAGLPLTSGFVAKFGVFSSAWSQGERWLVVVAVLASVIAFAVYLRLIVVMYMDESEEGAPSVSWPVRWVLALSVTATIVWGLFPGSLLDAARNALPL